MRKRVTGRREKKGGATPAGGKRIRRITVASALARGARRVPPLLLGSSKRTSERRTSRLREPMCGAAPTSLDGRASRQREVILLPTGATFEWCARGYVWSGFPGRTGVFESYALRPSVRLEHEVTANRGNRPTHQSRTTSSSLSLSLVRAEDSRRDSARIAQERRKRRRGERGIERVKLLERQGDAIQPRINAGERSLARGRRRGGWMKRRCLKWQLGCLQSWFSLSLSLSLFRAALWGR